MAAYLQIILLFLKIKKQVNVKPTQTHTINTAYGVITLTSVQPKAIEYFIKDLNTVKLNIAEIRKTLDSNIINSTIK